MDGIRPQDKGWILRANIKTPKQFSKKTAKFLTDQWRSNPSARAIYYSQQTIQNFLDSQNHIQKHKSP
jgi:hypothetical protein